MKRAFVAAVTAPLAACGSSDDGTCTQHDECDSVEICARTCRLPFPHGYLLTDLRLNVPTNKPDGRGGVTLKLEAFDEDLTVDDPVITCTAPLGTAEIRAGALSCISGSLSLAFTLVP